MKNRKVFWGGVIGLSIALALSISINWIYLLKKKYQVQKIEFFKTKEKSEKYERFIDNLFFENSYEGVEFPKVKIVDVDGQLISTDFTKKRGAMVLFFDPSSCQACLNTQLRLIEYFYRCLKEPQDWAVYTFGQFESNQLRRYKKIFNLTHSVASYNKDIPLKQKSLLKFTPIIFVVNSNNKIIKTHLPVKNQPWFSVIFFHLVSGNFEFSKPLFDGHLNRKRITEILNNEIDNITSEFFTTLLF